MWPSLTSPKWSQAPTTDTFPYFISRRSHSGGILRTATISSPSDHTRCWLTHTVTAWCQNLLLVHLSGKSRLLRDQRRILKQGSLQYHWETRSLLFYWTTSSQCCWVWIRLSRDPCISKLGIQHWPTSLLCKILLIFTRQDWNIHYLIICHRELACHCLLHEEMRFAISITLQNVMHVRVRQQNSL